MKTKSRRTPQPTHKAEPKKKRSTKSHQEEIAKTHAEEYPLQPSVPGVVGAGHACELFGPGACDTQLPVNEVIEEYTFGQFIRLRHTSPDGETRPVTGVVPKANDRNFLFTAGAGHLERAVSILALLAGKPEPLPSSQSTIQLQRVEIDDLDRLLVHRSIGKGKDKAVVSLDPDKVRRLLAGVPVETLARREQRDIRVLLVPASTSTATKPAVRQFAVADLAAFILRPEVPGVGGASYPVVLDATTIKQLRTDGVARVGTGETQVTLTIESGGASSSFLAGMDRDSTPITIGATKAQASMGMAKPIVIEPLPFLNIVSGFIPPAPPLSLDDFTLGLYLPWTQSWRLKGYSRGALLHSLTLAPQEETTIEVFTWDRRKRSLDQSSSFDSEQSIENSGTTKDMVDVIRELGSSSDFKIEGYGKVNMQSPWVQAEAGFKVEDISKLNDTSKHTLNHLVESTQKASARVRVNRQTKISESSETGSEERVTRKVRNPNMCRTLTLDYFEVLAHYIVTTAFAKDDAQICFFVPFPVALARKCFGEEDLRIHERALRGALINPELAGGFEAARTAWARNWAMDHVCDAPHCAHSEVSGSGEIKEGANAPSRALLETATQRVISICRELYYARVDDFCWYVMKHTKVFGSFDGKPGSSETRQVKLWAYV